MSEVGESKKTVGAEVVIVTGESSELYELQVEDEVSVLKLLRQVAEENKFELETKKYDFGEMVVKIDGVGDDKGKVWIYYVDDLVGEVAAGEKLIEPGQKVEWRYEEIK
jgi:hypothetical protein